MANSVVSSEVCLPTVSFMHQSNPTPGPRKICWCPTPGTDKVGNCRAVAQGGGWAQLDLIDALHNDDLLIGIFVLKRESNVALHGHWNSILSRTQPIEVNFFI